LKTITTDEFIQGNCALLDDPEGKKTYSKVARAFTIAVRELNSNLITDVRSSFGVVEDNMTVAVPDHTVDILYGGKWIKVGDGNVDSIYPFSKASGVQILDARGVKMPFNCVNIEPDVASGEANVSYDFINFNGADTFRLAHYGKYYGERYDTSKGVVFGYYSFDEAYKRIIIQPNSLTQPGDKFIYLYRSIECDTMYTHIPINFEPVIRARTMYYYWLNQTPFKASQWQRAFITAIDNYKRLTDKVSKRDLANAIHSKRRTTNM
jgi:hypothetical protein